MKFLKIEVELYQNGHVQYRVIGRNKDNMIAIGLTKPVPKDQAAGELNRVVKEMSETETHVPHITPLGQE